jgi:hypothetical protein
VPQWLTPHPPSNPCQCVYDGLVCLFPTLPIMLARFSLRRLSLQPAPAPACTRSLTCVRRPGSQLDVRLTTLTVFTCCDTFTCSAVDFAAKQGDFAGKQGVLCR